MEHTVERGCSSVAVRLAGCVINSFIDNHQSHCLGNASVAMVTAHQHHRQQQEQQEQNVTGSFMYIASPRGLHIRPVAPPGE